MFYTPIDFIKFISDHVYGPVLVQSIKCKVLLNHDIIRGVKQEIMIGQSTHVDIKELAKSAQTIPAITLASYIDKITNQLVVGIAVCSVRDYLDHKLNGIVGRRVAIMDAASVNDFWDLCKLNVNKQLLAYQFSEGMYVFNETDDEFIKRFIQRSRRYFKTDENDRPTSFKKKSPKSQSIDQVNAPSGKVNTTTASISLEDSPMAALKQQLSILFKDPSGEDSSEALRAACDKLVDAVAKCVAAIQTPPKADQSHPPIIKAKETKSDDLVERLEAIAAKIKADKKA